VSKPEPSRADLLARIADLEAAAEHWKRKFIKLATSSDALYIDMDKELTDNLRKASEGRYIKQQNTAKQAEILRSYSEPYANRVAFLVERNQTTPYTESKAARHYIIAKICKEHRLNIAPDGKLAREIFPIIK